MLVYPEGYLFGGLLGLLFAKMPIGPMKQYIQHHPTGNVAGTP